jgi:hypothetical protein
VARLPERVCIWPRLARMCLAHQVAIVPLSQLTMASLRSNFPSSQATHLALHGFVSPRGSFFHYLPPILHSGSSSIEETPMELTAANRHCV